jgi:septum formation topological specificity factor MinE
MLTPVASDKLSREEILENLALNKAAERLTVIMGRFRHSGVDSEDVRALRRGILALRSYGSIDEVRLKLTNKVIEDIAEQGYKEHGWRERIRAIIVHTLCGPRPQVKDPDTIENGVSPRHVTDRT